MRHVRTPLASTAMALLLAAPAGQAHINDTPNLPQALDTNPAANIFETTLVARRTQVNLNNPLCFSVCSMTNAITFNSMVPGPEIRVRVGDRVIVHYRSELPTSEGNTSIHWHGVELDNRSDGTAVNQQPVQPGGSYTYDFIAHRPGVFWFHGHMSPTNHTLKGHYGSLIVTGSEDTTLQSLGVLPPAARTKTLMLSDFTSCRAAGSNDDRTFPSGLPWAGDTNGDGVKDAFPGKGIGPSPRELCETPMDNHGHHIPGPLRALDVPNMQYEPHDCPTNKFIGLSKPCTIDEGQHVLVNGRIPAPRGGSPDGGGGSPTVPDSPDVLKAKPGDTFRLQMTNAALSRYFRLHLAGPAGQIALFRVGGEGGLLNTMRVEGGLNGNPRYLDANGLNSAGNPQYSFGEILVAPGQRSDVVFKVPLTVGPGDLLTLWTRDFQRGIGSDGANPLEKAPTGPCAAGPGRCGPNGFSLVPTVPVLHIAVVGGTGQGTPTTLGTRLRTDSRVNRPLEDFRGKPVGRLLTPSEAGRPEGRFDPRIALRMGSAAFPNHRPNVDGIVAMLDDNRQNLNFAAIPRPSTTRYVRLGDLVELTVKNSTGMNHPFHLHGASFQPMRLESNPDCAAAQTYRTFDYPEFVDTFDIPACTQLVFRVRYDDRPRPGGAPGGALGRWVHHCHIFEHAADGMMSEVDVVAPAGPRFFGLRPAGSLASGATVTARLRKRRLVVLEVRRVTGRGRRARTVRVGRVRLGRLPKGQSRRIWDLRVRGRLRRPGRYVVTMHALNKRLLSAPSQPGARSLTIAAGGRVRGGRRVALRSSPGSTPHEH